MRRRPVAAATAAACIILVLASLPAADPGGQSPSAEASKEVFGTNRVLSFHLEIPAEEYQAMQPSGGPGFPGPPGAPPKPPPKGEARDSERNLFGMAFPWVKGDFTSEGKIYRNVGLRYDGDGTYFAAARALKRPLQIQLDRFAGQQFHGLTTLNLHAGSLDPSRGREALAYSVFRAAGVPAPRTAFAEVTLAVPGKYDREYLGLYTVVEAVDGRFLQDRFRTGKGLLMRPERMRGLEHLGDDWERYKDQYRPRTEATKEQSRRVIEFARLLNQAGDEEFRKQIGSYLDVDGFLRFLAANALLANLDGFFALGHNYYLYLHPETGKLVFLPGDLELALANFLMMGSPDQLMDLSLTRPYPGENRLAERLLADREVSERYQKLLGELTATCFKKERLLEEIDAIEKTTKEILAKEAKAVAARKEGPGGFGPPGGMFARPPELRTFVEKRTASVAAQLAGKSKGHVPQFGFGPPPGGPKPNEPPVDDKTIRDIVQAPPGFDVTLFAAPPRVGYPVALAAAPTGEVFVAVDEQGSLGRTPGGGRLLRCIDRDGDGKADQVNVFAKMDHPRGVLYQNGTAWVLHPPFLSAFHDEDGDGTSDRQEVLVTGLTTEMIDTRGGDHTTNGIRMAIDGWIYIAVGDYGIKEAKGKDRTTVTLRGGGIVRVRPDGTDLEIFATGLRNPFEIAIDPYLNLFTRDNTNDGAGWDVRVSHLVQSAQYGYTQLYANFPDEIMPTLGSFGGGGGTGALYIEDLRWPEKYRTLYTGDWGRSEVYRHELRRNGATFDLQQEVFLKIPRPTGMDVDASGHLYVASWRGGEASVYVGPNVGFVARVTPRGLKPEPFPDLKQADLGQLVGHLASPNPVVRLFSQREVLRRGSNAETTRALVELASDRAAPLPSRVAAVFTIKQLDGKASHPALLKLTGDETVREFALRALTDRRRELDGVEARPFVAALADESPRVRAQALVSLGRLNDVSAAPAIIPLTARPKGSVLPERRPVHAQPDPDRVLPHLAMRALVALNAVDACLAAIDGPYREGALRAMRSMHSKPAVEGLIRKLGTPLPPEVRRDVLATLVRLHYREADYKGTWWGIRPDSTGPYYDRQEWDLSKRIAAVLTAAVLDGDPQTVAFLRGELARHRVDLPGVPLVKDGGPGPKEEQAPIVIPAADPKNPNQIGNMPYETAAKRTLQVKGDAERGKALFTSQSCRACHTDADGQTPKGPHLVDIGKRYSAAELVESILKPSAKLAQGFETYTFVLVNGREVTGFVVSESADAVQMRELSGVLRVLKHPEIEERQRREKSTMPEGLAANLTPEQLADLMAYLQSLH